eukprot:scaffold10417_cov33-Tisochrysis_lutea.AAC.2
MSLTHRGCKSACKNGLSGRVTFHLVQLADNVIGHPPHTSPTLRIADLYRRGPTSWFNTTDAVTAVARSAAQGKSLVTWASRPSVTPA